MNKFMAVVIVIFALGIGLVVRVWRQGDSPPRETNAAETGKGQAPSSPVTKRGDPNVVNFGDPPGTPTNQKTEFIIDDDSPESLVLSPPDGWKRSLNVETSHGESAKVAECDGTLKTATFHADILEDGEYEIFAWWNQTVSEYRYKNVPITIHTRTGDTFRVIDQTINQIRWNSLGRYRFDKGVHRPILTLSTNGLPVSETACVIADAIRMVKQ